MGASQGMAGTLDFFCTHRETIGGFRGKDDVVWLHFEKGRSGCFERRERVGRQACEAYCEMHISCNFPRQQRCQFG